MKQIAIVMVALGCSGCAGHKLTGYNLKTSVGQTAYEDGNRSLYTGASADFHFDVK